MRTLSEATEASTEALTTKPGWLVELFWATPLRLSSRGNISWRDRSWVPDTLVAVSTGEGGYIELANSNLAYSALVMNEGVADVGCQIWKFYGDAPGADDPVLIFDGVLDRAEINHKAVKITLAQESSRTKMAPRHRIDASGGFNHLRPAGTRISWGGQVYVLER